MTMYAEDDELEVEDQTGKIKIVLSDKCSINDKEVKQTDLPFGVVLAFVGRFNKKINKFLINELVLPEMPPQ